MEIIIVVFAAAIGFLSAWIILTLRIKKNQEANEEKSQTIQLALNDAEKKVMVTNETLRLTLEENVNLQTEMAQILMVSNARAIEVATLTTTNNNILEKLELQKSEIETLQKRLITEFGRVFSCQSQKY